MSENNRPASPAGNSASSGKRKVTKSTNRPGFAPRSDAIGIEELRGFTFQYGVPGQQAKFARTKKAIAEHLGITSDCGQDLYIAIMEGEEPEFEEPEDPGKTATKGQLQRYDILLKKVLAKEERYKIEKAKAFRLIIGQCSQAMRNKVEALPDFKSLQKNVDIVQLLKRMKELVDGTDHTQYQFWKMQAQLAKLVFIKQEANESVAHYSARFLDQVEATEQVFGKLVPTFDMKGEPSEEQMKNRNKLLACLFLAGSDRNRYKTVIDDLGNDFQLGKVAYPEDVMDMTQLLVNRRGINTNKAKQIEEMQDGVFTSFHQQNSHPKLVCRYCKNKGHVSEVCQKRIADEEAARNNNSNNNSNSNSNSNSGGHTNTQGWFDEVNPSSRDGVNSFQYMERYAWNQED
jgi:hypothetical protein